MAYDHQLAVALEAARQAGQLLLAEFNRPGGPRGALGDCPADAAAERVIRDLLTTDCPHYGTIGEELADEDRRASDADGHVWVIDPNDGTRAFQRGWRGAAVSIGLLRAGVPVLGVVYAYAAAAGAGDLIAWAEGTPLRRNGRVVTPAPWPAVSSLDTVFISQDADRKSALNAERCAPARFLAVPGIAYRLALAAVGDGVAAISLAGPTTWDVVAGHALLRARGGELYRAGGEPVRYAADGSGAVGDCFGGHPGFARELAQRDWPGLKRAPAEAVADYALALPEATAICADSGRLARAQGALAGLIAGNNLGALVGAGDARRVVALYSHGPHQLQDGGDFGLGAGQPGADGELAVVSARALAQAPRDDVEAIARACLHWYHSAPPEIGETTALTFAAAQNTLGGASSVRDVLSAAAARHEAPTNGALARLVPLALYAHRDDDGLLERRVEAACALTHAAPLTRAAAVILVRTVADAITAGEPPTVLHARALARARRHGDDILATALAAAVTTPPLLAGDAASSAPLALHNTFHHLLHAPDPATGVVATVRGGGDSPTLGALCGALLGAVHGVHALPAQWLDRVLTCRPLPGGAGRARPREFWPVDCLLLAERLLAAAARRA